MCLASRSGDHHGPHLPLRDCCFALSSSTDVCDQGNVTFQLIEKVNPDREGRRPEEYGGQTEATLPMADMLSKATQSQCMPSNITSIPLWSQSHGPPIPTGKANAIHSILTRDRRRVHSQRNMDEAPKQPSSSRPSSIPSNLSVKTRLKLRPPTVRLSLHLLEPNGRGSSHSLFLSHDKRGRFQ